jgi:hypothetical protein
MKKILVYFFVFVFVGCGEDNRFDLGDSVLEDGILTEEQKIDEKSTHYMAELKILKPTEVNTAIDNFEAIAETDINQDAEKLLAKLIIRENIANSSKIYKVFQEIKNNHFDKSIVLFGDNCADDKAIYCYKNFYGLLIINQNKLGKNYFILKTANTHTRLQNVKWEDDNFISYEILKLFGDPNTGEGNTIEKWIMKAE